MNGRGGKSETELRSMRTERGRPKMRQPDTRSVVVQTSHHPANGRTRSLFKFPILEKYCAIVWASAGKLIFVVFVSLDKVTDQRTKKIICRCGVYMAAKGYTIYTRCSE